MKTILVTGGAGFLGSHLCRSLLKQGHWVICCDSCISGSKENIQELMSNPKFEFLRHDVTTKLVIEADEIYHLACPASPVHYQHDAIKTLKTNVMGTLNILGLARQTGAKILMASTSEVYGDPSVHPQKEDYNGNVNCIGLRSCYDEGKRAAEALCMDYHRQHKVDVRIARIFNTYGPRLSFNDGRVVSNLIVQGLRGDPLTIYGDGSQSRSFCYVDDLIEGLMKLMASSCITPVNIGNPAEVTILELAQKIRSMLDTDLDIETRRLPQDDPARRRPDITKAREVLGWKPTIDLDVGLRRTIEDFKERAKLHPEDLLPAHQKECN